jgi:hypothetical protein
MTHHDLKTIPVAFEAIWRDRKTFEVRLNDRLYQAGDTVTLREFDLKAPCTCLSEDKRCTRECARYSGRTVTADVGFVMSTMPGRGGQRGFNAGDYVVFSLCSPRKVDARTKSVASPVDAIHRVASAGSL